MKKLIVALLMLASLAATAQTSKHVFIIVDENHRYQDVLAKMPYLVSLGNQYAHTSNYRADVSGSLMDYLWLSSGSSEKAFGCTGGGCSSPITSDNIFRALNKAGLSWKSYQEDLPYIGYMGYGSGLYVKRHNPAPYYSDVISSKTEQQKIVPLPQLDVDIAAGTVPNYSFITPNLVNDAHNKVGTTDLRLETADKWLSVFVPKLLATSYFKPGGDGVLFITFDECDGASTGICGGDTELVYTAVIGQGVKPHSVSSAPYRHENTLRTMMDLMGMSPSPGAAATAQPMFDLFTPPGLTVTVPRDGASALTSPVRVTASNPKAVKLEVWVDYHKVKEVYANSIDALVPMTVGKHRFVVRSVDAAGALATVVETITTIK